MKTRILLTGLAAAEFWSSYCHPFFVSVVPQVGTKAHVINASADHKRVASGQFPWRGTGQPPVVKKVLRLQARPITRTSWPRGQDFRSAQAS